jgi:hypothetical protein
MEFLGAAAKAVESGTGGVGEFWSATARHVSLADSALITRDMRMRQYFFFFRNALSAGSLQYHEYTFPPYSRRDRALLHAPAFIY